MIHYEGSRSNVKVQGHSVTKGVGTGRGRGAMAPSFSYKGASVTLPPPPIGKLKMKIAETAQRIMWIKRNVITDHAKNVAEK